jgi:branched-chain amino acid transport system substrate-binding protein
LNNALVGSWPIVEVRKGKVDIVEMANQAVWYDQHKELVVKRFREENLMPDQKK